MSKSDADWTPGRPENQTVTEREQGYPSRQTRRKKNVPLLKGELKAWEVWCETNGWYFYELVEKSIRHYLGEVDAQTPSIRSNDPDRSMIPSSLSRSLGGRPDAQPVENADNEAQAKENYVLNFYCEATGARLRETDKAVYRESLANLAPHIITIGIVNSVIRNAFSNNPGRINSLKYCLGAIDEAAAHGSQQGMMEMLKWSIDKRPTYRDSLPPIVRDNLRRAFAVQPMLPGTGGADVIPFGEKGTET